MTTDTDQQINERLTRFCGWEWRNEPGNYHWFRDGVERGCPDYLNDGSVTCELMQALRAKFPGVQLQSIQEGWIFTIFGMGDLQWSAGLLEDPQRAVALVANEALEALNL